MKLKYRIVCAALLVAAAAPAFALRLGQIQVKSALNQPLVAAIPLHPANLTELEGLTVELAPAADFARAGLPLTPVDRTLRFHVVTDNNGRKLILVTSPQPITDPYLDFLVQVGTRQGRQVREFVVLLNPVIASPAPEVQAAPVASAPPPAPPAATMPERPLQSPPPLEAPQYTPQPAPQAAQPVAEAAPEPAAPQPAAVPQPGGTIDVEHGNTLYGIAKQEVGDNRGSINQMMLALKAANPDAFFRDNINDLKSGVILRIPTRDEIDRISVAAANAAVHRQYASWRTARPRPATMVAGTAAEAAANAAPAAGKTGSESDHLTLVPAAGEGGGGESRPGVAGGTGKDTVAGLRQQLQNDRGSLISLAQSNADLVSRVRSLQDISGKTDTLLSLKDATIAELQRKLGEIQSRKAGAAAASANANASAALAASPKAAAKPAARPVPPASAPLARWLQRPLTWLIAGLVVLALLWILLRKRRGKRSPPIANGPLPDPEDIVPAQVEASGVDEEAALRAAIEAQPGNLANHVALCRLLHARDDERAYIEAAKAMREHVIDLHGDEWREVAELGEDLAPHLPLFELPPEAPHDPYGMAALQAPVVDDATVVRTPALPEAEQAPAARTAQVETAAPTARNGEPDFNDDPVDTKLDLARAYLDMGDPVGARAMLEEVLQEGSPPQKDEAKRLLADVPG
jgi:pilus assembly protein FimV